jgi:hypothetical protein
VRAAALVPALVLAAASLFACGAPAPPPPVAVRAAAADLASLIGEWNGEYSSAASGRSGAIHLILQPGEDTAYGDVLMIPARAEGPFQPVNRDAETAGPQPLSIRFVAVSEGVVSGTLEPYRDPDCNCVLSTTFTGTLRGNTIEGTFVSQGGPGRQVQDGRWRVDRKK